MSTLSSTGSQTLYDSARVTPSTILSVDRLSLQFGGLTALNQLSFSVKRNTITALIGPNGAGKTSFFNCVSRLYDPSSGQIFYNDKDITNKKSNQIAAMGIARTFQNLALMPSLSVIENVMLGGHTQGRTPIGKAFFVPVFARKEEKHLREQAHQLLDLLNLSEYQNYQVQDLSYPTLKKVEIARALACEPKLLMLDEPAGGLSHSEVDELAELLTSIQHKFGLTLLLVEHHMGMVMKISEEIVVLDFGNKIAEGIPSEIQSNPRVIEAYLGKSRERT